MWQEMVLREFQIDNCLFRPNETTTTMMMIMMAMIEWGQKSKPQKIPLGLPTKPIKIPGPKINLQKNPMLNLQALKIYRKVCTLLAELRSWDMQTMYLRLFWIPKKSLLKSCHTKNTSQIFLPPKITESKISNPQKSFDHPCHLISRVPPLPSPPGVSAQHTCTAHCPICYLFIVRLNHPVTASQTKPWTQSCQFKNTKQILQNRKIKWYVLWFDQYLKKTVIIQN